MKTTLWLQVATSWLQPWLAILLHWEFQCSSGEREEFNLTHLFLNNDLSSLIKIYTSSYLDTHTYSSISIRWCTYRKHTASVLCPAAIQEGGAYICHLLLAYQQNSCS